MEYTRRGLVIWVYSLKNFNKLKNFGEIHYVSQRMNYIMMYVDEHQIDETIQKIERLHFVRKIDKSYIPDIDMTFAHALDNAVLVPSMNEEIV